MTRYTIADFAGALQSWYTKEELEKLAAWEKAYPIPGQDPKPCAVTLKAVSSVGMSMASCHVTDGRKITLSNVQSMAPISWPISGLATGKGTELLVGWPQPWQPPEYEGAPAET